MTKRSKPIDLSIKDLSRPPMNPDVVIDPRIPKIPFSLCVYGKTRSGKTMVLANMLKHYEKHFKNRTIVFSKERSDTLDIIIKNLNAVAHYNLIDSNGNDIIRDIIKFQQEEKELGHKLEDVLLVFDDFITEKQLQKKNNVFDLLFAMGRHPRVSVLITAQNYTKMPSGLRRMAMYHILFKLNGLERKYMIPDRCDDVSMEPDEFEKVFMDCTNEKYSFMYIDALNEKWTKRFGV